MLKTRTPKQRIESAVESTVAIHSNRTYQIPEAPTRSDGSKLALAVTMGDIKTVVTTELRRRFVQAREIAEHRLQAAKTAQRDGEKLMEDMCQQLLQSYQVENGEPLRVANEQWLGQPVTLVAEKTHSPDYYSRSDPEDRSVEIDCEERVINGKIRFTVGKKYNNNPSIIDELDKPFVLPFSPAMLTQLDVLVTAKTAVETARQELTSMNRMLAELPVHGDAVQSAFVKAHFRGQLTSTAQIMSLIEQATNQVVLPPGVSQAIALLPAPQPEP